MKKNLLYIVLLIIILGTSIHALKADGATSTAQEVELKKQISGPSRAPALYPVSFHGYIFMNTFTLYAENYSGSIQIVISSNSGLLTQTVQINETDTVNVDLSSLPESNYHIQIITEAQGIFAGDFDL